MQDNAQHEQEQQVQEAGTYYPVLEVGLSDFEDDWFDQDELDDDATKAYNERLDFARQMSSEQWRHLAEYMHSILFDPDKWNDALDEALDRAMAHAKAVSDHQAMQEARR